MSETLATFRSPTNNLRLVKEQTTRKMSDRGEWYEVPGVTLEFRDGVLDIIRDDEGTIRANGRPVGDDVEEWLSNHPSVGVYFHEVGSERDRPADDAQGVLRRIIRLAAEGNTDEIGQILVSERSSYSRPEVIAAAEEAIEANSGEVPERSPTPEHQVERVRREPAVGVSVPPVDHPRPTSDYPLAEDGDQGYVGDVPEEAIQSEPVPDQPQPGPAPAQEDVPQQEDAPPEPGSGVPETGARDAG